MDDRLLMRMLNSLADLCEQSKAIFIGEGGMGEVWRAEADYAISSHGCA